MRGPLRAVFLCSLAATLFPSGTPLSARNPEVPRGRVPSSAGEVHDILPPLRPGEDFHVNDAELGKLLRILLKENPDILAARHRWLSSRERPPQAKSLPDPQVAIRYYPESIETRVGPIKGGLELAQRVPWLSKLSTEGRRAESLASGMEKEVRQIERDRVRDFKKSYFDLIYAVEALGINEEERGLLRRFERIALTRYSTGEGIQQNAIKVQTEITRLIDQAAMLREFRDVLTQRLGSLLGGNGGMVGYPQFVLEEPSLELDAKELEMQALESRPMLAALRERIRADQYLVKRRRLESRPDFSFGIAFTDVGRRRDSVGRVTPPEGEGDDALALVAGITIPLHTGRISSGIQEAREILNADFRLLEGAEDRVRFDVQEAAVRLESLLERVVLYRDNLIPQAEQSLFSSQAAYRTNQIDFLDLIDAERVWFQVRLTHRRLLSDVWIALADLESAIGSKFPATVVEGGMGP